MSLLLRLHHNDIMTIVKFVSSPDGQGVVLQLGLGLGPGNESFPLHGKFSGRQWILPLHSFVHDPVHGLRVSLDGIEVFIYFVMAPVIVFIVCHLAYFDLQGAYKKHWTVDCMN